MSEKLLPFEWPVYAVKMKGSEDLYFFDPSLGNRYNTGDGWLVLLPWGEERNVRVRPFGPDNRVIREPEEVEWMEQLNATHPSAALTDEELRETVEEIGKRLYDSLGLPHDNDKRGAWLYRLWMMTKRDIIDRVRRLSTRHADQGLREAAVAAKVLEVAKRWERGDTDGNRCLADIANALAALNPEEQKR